MSDGRKTSWTAERRAASSKRMRARWRDRDYRQSQTEKYRAKMGTAEARAAASARMKALNVRMRDDDALKAKCVRGQKRVRRSPGYRSIQSAVMTDIMTRPELRRQARFHCIKINKNPKVRRRQVAGRRRKAAAAQRVAA